MWHATSSHYTFYVLDLTAQYSSTVRSKNLGFWWGRKVRAKPLSQAEVNWNSNHIVKNRGRRADNQSDFQRKAEQGLLRQKPPFWLFYPAMRYWYFTLLNRQKAVLFFGQTLRHPIIKRLTCFALQLHNILPFPLLNFPSIPSKKLYNSHANIAKPFSLKTKCGSQ